MIIFKIFYLLFFFNFQFIYFRRVNRNSNDDGKESHTTVERNSYEGGKETHIATEIDNITKNKMKNYKNFIINIKNIQEKILL